MKEKPNTWKNLSGRPKILYWFWAPSILENEKYLKDLRHIAEKSCYTMVALTARDGLNFFDRSLLPHFKKAVALAHELGLQIVLQVWPEGFLIPAEIDAAEAAVLISEAETVVPKNGRVQLYCSTDAVRRPDVTCWMKSELSGVYTFEKTGEGTYRPGTLRNVADRAVCTVKDGEAAIELSLPELKGHTVYALVSHTYAYADLFGEFMTRSYRSLMEDLREAGFDSMVLDEFKNINIKFRDFTFRDRFGGNASEQNFEETTGCDFLQTMLEMRYVPDGQEGQRAAAINRYFDWMRKGPLRFEKTMAELVREFYGPDAFIGLHNTFHNELQNDEMWATGCNWWEIPRRYSQTDESITMPVQLGMACQTPENIHYDMHYGRDMEGFYSKAIEEARLGGRVHYHAMNDLFWGVDLGREDFLQEMNEVEKKVELLNIFNGPMPKLDLLIVFGMPALCNWYPDIEARNAHDLNGKLNIMQRADALWKAGVRCAMAPSDAVDDGRIRPDGDGFDDCGHHFSALLYLYPQYAKESTLRFLEEAISSGKNVRVIGAYERSFEGRTAALSSRRLLRSVTLAEEDDPIAAMQLPLHPTTERCELENGAQVFSSWESLKTQTPHPFVCRFGGTLYEGAYIGTAALQCSPAGEPERFVCGGFTELRCNGKVILSSEEPADVYWTAEENILHVL